MLNTIKEQARGISSSKSGDGEEMPSGPVRELLVLVKLSYFGEGCTGVGNRIWKGCSWNNLVWC